MNIESHIRPELASHVRILKALADASRLRILNSLRSRGRYVEEIAEQLGLAVSTISFHLKKLEQAGVVNRRRDQYYAVYRVNPALLRLTLDDLVSCVDHDKGVQEERLAEYRRGVLRAFFRNGKLIRLPAQQKKRLIVLEEFRNRFVAGQSYPEHQVDDMIRPLFNDYCTVRRELIESGMMTRHNGCYTLAEPPRHARHEEHHDTGRESSGP
jgi:biotin operon repressor